MEEEHLVSGFTFFSSSPDGTVPDTGGLFHRDVRHLSTLEVTIREADMTVLGEESIRPWRRILTAVESIQAVNDITDDGWDAGPLVIKRAQHVHDGYRERIEVTNRSTEPRSVSLSVRYGTDFADIFEVRGTGVKTDRHIERKVADDEVAFNYAYQDDDERRRERSTVVSFSDTPDDVRDDEARFTWTLASQASDAVTLAVRPGVAGSDEPTDGDRWADLEPPDSSDTSPATGSDEPRSPPPISPLFRRDDAPIATGRRAYDRSIARAADELRALAAATDVGPVPVAGVPWFDTVFGRDSVLTAYLAVPVAPALAGGTLRFLADYQGRSSDPDRDEAPGKMFHELRFGELARTGVVPHSPYFGSVDATPLWIVLLHELYRWTGDPSVVRRLWRPLEGALAWLDAATERIGDDPFLYYEVTDESGVYHKTWRDSTGSLRRHDGTEPPSPIASAEVQGYLYDAFTRVASLMREFETEGTAPSPTGEADLARRADGYERRAEQLQSAFDDAFWLPGQEYYAAAVAGGGAAPVEAVTSNVGQCLWSGIVPADRADDVVATIRAPGLSSEWGIRTVSSTEAAYHPASYHRGSVWPHDTALVGLGLARSGYQDAAETLATKVFEASSRVRDHSLPELFCGFDASQQPTAHPAACRPQAWAAAAPFGALRAIYDLQPGGASSPSVNATPACLAADALDDVVRAWSPGGAFRSTDGWATGGPARDGGAPATRPTEEDS